MTRKGIIELFFCNDLFVLPGFDNIVRACILFAFSSSFQISPIAVLLKGRGTDFLSYFSICDEM
jgi:hypothetical protein